MVDYLFFDAVPLMQNFSAGTSTGSSRNTYENNDTPLQLCFDFAHIISLLVRYQLMALVNQCHISASNRGVDTILI